MTSRSVICFKIGIALLVVSELGAAATVTGMIELTRADRRDVAVWLEPLDANAAPPSPHRARMLQKDKRFQPHVLVVSTGTTIDFPNADPIFHNAFSNFNGQIFDIGLYPPGKTRSVVFRDPGIVRVFCNIHPSMAALIVVVRTPFFALTDPAGHYSIPNVRPGDYEIHIFDERATPETLGELKHRVLVVESSTLVPPIAIPEAGYLLTPHSNKYGKPYPPGADENSSYTIPQ